MAPPVSKSRYIVNDILSQVISGKLGPGDRLESERNLTAAYGVSLGTVQRAMEELARRGVVTREVGRGTFIRGLGSSVDARYIRFQNMRGEELPVLWKIIGVNHIATGGDAVEGFFGKRKSLTRIDRLVDINRKTSMVSQFYVSRRHFGLLTQDEDLKDGTNLRLILSERLAMPSLRLEQRFGFEPMSDEVARIIKPESRRNSFVIEFRGYSDNDRPVFLQRIIGEPSTEAFFVTDVRS